MSLDVTLPDDALDMRLDVWLDRYMESLRTLPLTRKTIDNRVTIAKAVQALLGSVRLRDLKPFMILRMLAATKSTPHKS